MKKNITFIATAGLIAAIYVVLVMIFRPISFSEIQVRVAEALTILPVFTPAAVPGLFLGCLIGNVIGGAALPDIIFGSIATLIGAIVTYLFRKKSYLLAPVGPTVSNTIIIPIILKYAYGVNLPIALSMLYIFAGEFISCGILGILLLIGLKKTKIKW